MAIPIFVILNLYGNKTMKIHKYLLVKFIRIGGMAMTKEQSIKEVEYKMALKLLKILLSRGIITDEEYVEIDELNRQTFSPELREVYV